MDDERLKEAKNSYFDEILARIRDIRSSEKVFWKKVLNIYATSIDYSPNDEIFLKTIYPSRKDTKLILGIKNKK